MNKYFLLCVPFSLGLMPYTADAAIRVGNLSRNNAQAYQQVNELRYNAANANAVAAAAAVPAELPINVANTELAEQIKSGDTNAKIGVSELERCSMIYPNGEFAWARPTLGAGTGGASTCVAVVELRAVGAGINGSDAILARANLAAGDGAKCNIDDFPQATWLPAAGEIEFPADREPTIDDVKRVMNREQKQDAGLKIAAGAVIGGLGGNIAGKNEVGHDGLLGGGKAKTQSTIIGAVSGAALMAGNAYAGKVGGDVILSTGVNAAAGGVMGNMVASGDSVIRIENCEIDGLSTKCLWGMLVEEQSLGNKTAFYNIVNETTVLCDSGLGGEYTGCTPVELVSITLDAYSGETVNGHPITLDEIASRGFDKIDNVPTNTFYYKDGKITQSGDGDKYAKISTASRAGKKQPAMIAGVVDKTFGYKRSDWNKLRSEISSANKKIYGRSAQGKPFELTADENYSINSFYPMYIDAGDGGIIDLGNKARLKSTLTGAGIGGAMGAFVGYQGAQTDIENRWVAEVMAYKDSLQKVYCATGNRFLSQYNDMIIIPNMSE
ncbi:MAG: hypothetical protein IJX43_03485 [Alphaproteobacteria bacterium]|nr:hypothetical protein [Alphaproteobacteria bacterium]